MVALIGREEAERGVVHERRGHDLQWRHPLSHLLREAGRRHRAEPRQDVHVARRARLRRLSLLPHPQAGSRSGTAQLNDVYFRIFQTENSYILGVQRPQKRYACFAKQQPGRAQGQAEISRNIVQSFFEGSVQLFTKRWVLG